MAMGNVGALSRGWQEFKIAVSFLTIIPTKVEGEITSERLASSMGLFPAVGMALGLALVILNAILQPLIPKPVLDCLLILTLIAATGALHLDGVADLFDGLAGSRDLSRSLEIMKDSRVGAVGVVALVMVLLLKYVSLVQMPAINMTAALILMPTTGRWMQICLTFFCDYIQREDSRAGSFLNLVGERELLIGSLTLIIVSVVLLGVAAFHYLVLVAIVAWLLVSYFKHRLGGITGDVLGAGTEITEIAALILILAVC